MYVFKKCQISAKYLIGKISCDAFLIFNVKNYQKISLNFNTEFLQIWYFLT